MSLLLLAILRLGRNMAVEIEAGCQRKQQRHAQQAKDLEIDPDLLGQVEGDIGIERGANRKKECPGHIDLGPDSGGQLQLLAQHLLEQWLLVDKLADQQGNGEQQVDDGNLPLDKDIVVEDQGEAAKHQH